MDSQRYNVEVIDAKSSKVLHFENVRAESAEQAKVKAAKHINGYERVGEATPEDRAAAREESQWFINRPESRRLAHLSVGK